MNLPYRYNMPGLELRICNGKAIFKKGTYRLRRARWLIKKARKFHPRKGSKATLQKRKKGIQIQRGGGVGGGGDPDTLVFPTSTYASPPHKSSQTAQLSSLRSTKSKAGLSMPMACAVICIGMKLRRYMTKNILKN